MDPLGSLSNNHHLLKAKKNMYVEAWSNEKIYEYAMKIENELWLLWSKNTPVYTL